MSLNFNVGPYYDDFDATKNFHRILFKPGYAVQARELTQAQSILQDQITKFGLGIYKDGSKVTGANIWIDSNIITLKVTSAVSSTIDSFVGLYAVGGTSGFCSQIISVDDINYYLRTKAVNVANGKSFSSGETINIYASKSDALNAALGYVIAPQYTATATTSTSFTRNATGSYLSTTLTMSTAGLNVGDNIVLISAKLNTYVTSILSSTQLTINTPLTQDLSSTSITINQYCSVYALEVGIDEGVWFTNGYFVRNSASTIIPDALNAFPSVVVGFEVVENEVDSYGDSSLLDPAIGASNYQAPGADRYQIVLNLVTKPYLSTQVVQNLTTNKFIELCRINSGIVESITTNPNLSNIGDLIAQGISDQSGDFIVQPFSLDIGDYFDSANTLPATISAGKAYIAGYPVEKISSTPYQLEKARDTQTVSYQDISTYYGNYIKVTNLRGSIPNFQIGTQVELHNVASTLASSLTKIGYANIRNFNYDSGTGSSSNYKAFLYNVSLSNNPFANVVSMAIPYSGSYTTPTFAANVVSGATLTDSNYNSLVFALPVQNIANVANTNYVTRRYFNATSFTNGQYTINTNGSNEQFIGGSGTIASALRQLNFAVVTTSSSGSYASGTLIPMDQSNVSITITNTPGSAGQASINIGGGFNGSASIYATVSVAGDAIKNKVLHLDTAVPFSANAIGTPIDLGVSDIYNFKGIFEIGNTATYFGTWSNTTTYPINAATFYSGNVYVSLANTNINYTPDTNPSWWSAKYDVTQGYYVLDNGQKDAYYDHGKVTNTSGVARGQAVAVFDYFTHSGGLGFFTVNSYPVTYSQIPTFTSPQYGTTYNLRDVIDFRPRRTDGIGVTTFDNFQIPEPFSDAFTDYKFYLQRIDKVVMYPTGVFKTLRGVSSYNNPIAPADIPDALTLFTLQYPPYTVNSSVVVNTPTTLRRYTMRDIGLLDTRISNLEYYTSLSLAEKEVTGSDVTDSTGLNILFKNGFLVDGFNGGSVADVSNPDYAASIDTTNKYARPLFFSNVAQYNVVATQGSFKTTTGKQNNSLFLNDNIVTFSYDETPLVFQNVATEIINVNPFNVVNFYGAVKLSPSSDIWYDTATQPAINLVNEDQAAWSAAVGGTGNGSQWNDWQINWSGQDIVASTNTPQISRDTAAITNAISSQGLTSTVQGGPVTVSSTTKVVSNAIIPYARTIPVSFEVSGLSPSTQIHTFINGTNVDAYITPSNTSTDAISSVVILSAGSGYTNGNNQSIVVIQGSNSIIATATANVVGGQISAINMTGLGAGYNANNLTVTINQANTSPAVLQAVIGGAIGGKLISDKHGYINGTVNIPNDAALHFQTGALTFEWSDNSLYTQLSKTYATARFTSQGTLETLQTTVVSTRPPSVTSKLPPPPPPPPPPPAPPAPTPTPPPPAPVPSPAPTVTTGTYAVQFNPVSGAYGVAATLFVYLSNIAPSNYSFSIPYTSTIPGVSSGSVTVNVSTGATSGYAIVNLSGVTGGSGGTLLTTVSATQNTLTFAGNQSTFIMSAQSSTAAPAPAQGVYGTNASTPVNNYTSSANFNVNGWTYAQGRTYVTNIIQANVLYHGSVVANLPAGGGVAALNLMFDYLYNEWVAHQSSNPTIPTMLSYMNQALQSMLTYGSNSTQLAVFINANSSYTGTSMYNWQADTLTNLVEALLALSSTPTGTSTALTSLSNNCFNGIDPLSQNFFVSETQFPRGVFLSSVDLFVATKDVNVPLSIRIRPTVNGYPDAINDVPGSIVYLNPDSINVPAQANIFQTIGSPTTFTFNHPVYLAPGQYSLMIASDSDQYNLYAAKVGDVQYGTGTSVSTVTYAGALFKSQNSSTWIPSPSEELAFTLRICDFAGGSATFDITSLASSSPIYFDLMQLMTSDMTFSDYDSITYKTLTVDNTTSVQSGEVNIFANQNYEFATRQIQSSAGNIIIRPTLTNADRFTSPVIDLERLNTILVQNIISPYVSSAANTTYESLGGFGNDAAVAKYITRRVTLNNNFDSTGLTVYMDVNRRPGTSIEVYYKVQNSQDPNNFDNQPYVLMSPKSVNTVGGSVLTTGVDNWTSDTYQALNITYNDQVSGSTYKNFKVFSIKVVFYSSNPALVPKIKNFRAIATA
jgi:hypothetical protein